MRKRADGRFPFSWDGTLKPNQNYKSNDEDRIRTPKKTAATTKQKRKMFSKRNSHRLTFTINFFFSVSYVFSHLLSPSSLLSGVVRFNCQHFDNELFFFVAFKCVYVRFMILFTLCLFLSILPFSISLCLWIIFVTSCTHMSVFVHVCLFAWFTLEMQLLGFSRKNRREKKETSKNIIASK